MLFRKVFALLIVLTLLGCVPATLPASTPAPEQRTSTPAPTSTLTPTPAPTDTPAPTLTPTAEPAATSTGEASAEQTSEATVTVTEDLYRDEKLGIVWHQPEGGWMFQDARWMRGFMGPDISPLVVLTPAEETDLRLIILATVDLPPESVQMLTELIQIAPDMAMESMISGMGDLGEDAEITEVAGEPTIFTRVDDPTMGSSLMWMVIRPHAMLYFIAEGFQDVASAEATFDSLEFIEPDVEFAAAEQESSEVSRDFVVSTMEGLRGLETKSPVTFEYMTRDELQAKMEASVEEELDRDRMAAEDRMLKLFEWIPADSDLLTLALDLQVTAIGGFYDDEEDTFYLIGEEGDRDKLGVQDQVIVAHEYVHALQDQYFDLSRFTQADEGVYNEDEASAFRALVEGDAQMAENQYIFAHVGFGQLSELWEAESELDYDALEDTPAYLQESLIFPYVQGTLFVQSIFEQGGWEAVNEVWDAVPASTEQVLHPEKYPDDAPTEVTLPDDLAESLGEGWTETLRNVWGEAQLLFMFGDNLGLLASQGADGWDGDQYVFLTHDDQELFVMETVWDSAEEAEEGANAFRDWARSNLTVLGDGQRFEGEDRSAYVGAAGDRVFFALTDDRVVLDTAVEALGWEE